MDWLANTPSHAKREGFFISDKEVEGDFMTIHINIDRNKIESIHAK
ncbi:MAG: hypothetical protein ABIF87_00090 [Pseudomonadota bacterium]